MSLNPSVLSRPEQGISSLVKQKSAGPFRSMRRLNILLKTKVDVHRESYYKLTHYICKSRGHSNPRAHHLYRYADHQEEY